MNTDQSDRWNTHYQQSRDEDVPPAAAVLRDNRHLLPNHGVALDLACGRGGNALLLAAAGLESRAWDFASSALKQLDASAEQQSLTIHTECRDVVRQPPEPDTCDVIVVSHFLERGLMPYLRDALRPGALLFYETFIHEAVTNTGPRNPDYRLGPNELLRLLPELSVVYYREEGRLGDLQAGFRDRAQYIGCRR